MTSQNPPIPAPIRAFPLVPMMKSPTAAALMCVCFPAAVVHMDAQAATRLAILQAEERAAKLRGKKFTPIFPSPDLRWSHWTQLRADTALKEGLRDFR